MMRLVSFLSSARNGLGLLALCSATTITGWAQSPALDNLSSPPEPAHVALPSTATLPASYPVITIQDRCPDPSKGAKATKPCKTVVTRAEFEKLAHALDPNMTKFERRQLAENYGGILSLAREALRRGVDKEPEYLEKMRYTRLRLLAAEVSADIYHDSMRTSARQEKEYYQQHADKFRRFRLLRLFIPRQKQPAPDDPEATVPEMKALAGRIRARAATGEDFPSLQKEIIAATGLNGEFDVDVRDVSRNGLPRGHEQAFDLAPGAVSEPITDNSGFYIYKMVSNELPSFEEVKQLVALDLQSSLQSAALASIRENSKPEVNQDYFEKYDPPAAAAAESDLEND